MSASALATRSIAKKVFTALTGLFLVIFLLGHLAGNLQLFIQGDAGKFAFNEYAQFMTTNPAVKVLSYVTYFSILFHAFMGIYLTVQNRKARPIGYAKENAGANSSWMSRYMAPLGVLILVFLVIHLRAFWYEMHFGDVPLDANGLKDLHAVVYEAFSTPWYVAIYVFSMLVLAFHLAHGFESGFQSIGANHPKYTPLIHKAGLGLSIVVPLLFAAIPVYILVVG